MQVTQLRKNNYGRYEIDSRTEVHCGDVIEIRIHPNGSEQGKWEKVQIEHDGNDYYAVGHKELCLQGLWVRSARR